MDVVTTKATYSGNYVKLPEGYHYITAPIVLSAGDKLEGPGSSVCFLVNEAGTAELVTQSGAKSVVQGFTMERASAAGGDAGFAIVVSAADCKILDVRTDYGFATTGISITSAGDRTVLRDVVSAVADAGDAPTVGLVAKLFVVVDAAAVTTDTVHALIDTTSLAATTTGFTNPAVPRNIVVTKAASWDGGTVTVTGTDQYDRAVSEVFPALGAGAEQGAKIFKTVTSCQHSIALAGGNGYSLGMGKIFGVVGKLTSTTQYTFTKDATAEAATLNLTYDSFEPTTTPDASLDYKLLTNVRL